MAEWWVRVLLIVGPTMLIIGTALILRLGSRKSLGSLAPFSRESPVESQVGVVVLIVGGVLTAIGLASALGFQF